MNFWKLFIQESPGARLMETDITIRTNLLRSEGHWLGHLISRGYLRAGMGFQLRARNRVGASGIIEGMGDTRP